MMFAFAGCAPEDALASLPPMVKFVLRLSGG